MSTAEFINTPNGCAMVTTTEAPEAEMPAHVELAESLLPHAYLFAKIAMVMPLFQEARDALTAITEAQRIRHGISPTLADRMDVAGTYSLDDWNRRPQDSAQGSASGIGEHGDGVVSIKERT